jgi:hypothetical protein
VAEVRPVYLVGPLESPLTAAMAAVAACGEGALLSHHPAAVLWSIRRPPARAMHITVSGRAMHARSGIQIHRAVEEAEVQRARLTPFPQ